MKTWVRLDQGEAVKLLALDMHVALLLQLQACVLSLDPKSCHCCRTHILPVLVTNILGF